jgi:6-phosphofructokinase 1
MVDVAVANARKMQMDCLVCLGGGGTQKNALRLHKAGLDVLTLPKTIDNDVAETEMTFGFDTAMGIATEAIDRLHTTATSHHRIIVLEIMGHYAGWLALGAGIAGGADVVMIPEIPYNLECVAEHLLERRRSGKRFSIIAIAEGAMSEQEAAIIEQRQKEKEERKKSKKGKKDKKKKKSLLALPQDIPPVETTVVGPDGKDMVVQYHCVQESKASQVARQLQQLTGTEARVTSLGHVQRGGSPSSTDRLLCTNLGTKAADLLAQGKYNVMVALKEGEIVAVPIEKVAGHTKLVPLDHQWIKSALNVGTCMGNWF